MLGRAPRPDEIAAGDVVPGERAGRSRAVQLGLSGRAARTFLESHGIHAVVFDTQSNFYSDGAMVGVRLMVLDEEYDEARKLLKDYKS